ncbi:MAG TPA: 1-(5-phosphoribosyl)-5-[(5-phosphoribosylamino)methylideneamino]imidazole-4-carboxamide isomerase [Nitrososphaeraceae archaeon]|jgi:phosphoribosylformimino-5-aminoimidazole carboxamide ribotide isomerase
MKIVPSIDLLGGNVVRLIKGRLEQRIIYSNDPVKVAKKWEDQGADLLHIVDLDSALRTGTNNTSLISKVINSLRIPIQIGGGIRSADAIKLMFEMGVSKVVIGTMAFKEPTSLKRIAKSLSSKIVISIDQLNGMIMVDGWRESAGIDIIHGIKMFMSMGLNEFLLTSIDRDGTMTGPDVESLSTASKINGTNIIASGGISSILDIIKIRNTGCSSVILGRALYEERFNVAQAKALA